MNALLRYLFLKSMRDRSLPVLLLCGPAFATAAVIGVCVAQGRLHYPFSPEWDKDVLELSAPMWAATIAGISAFWTLRSEVATKAIASFLLARRPISVAIALVVFGAATGVATAAGAVAVFGVLTAALPPSLFVLTFATMIISLAAASLGALYVTISAQPAMYIWATIAGFPLAPWLVERSNWPRLMMIAPFLAIVCTVISAFLLRRRCAT